MGVTLKDLLPALGGLAAGSISPNVGRAGANTLGAVDQLQQRNRRQTLEDERMQMSRDSAGRAERGEKRAVKSFEWGQENQAHMSRERSREESERAHARQSGAKMLQGYEDAGIDVPEGYATAALGVNAPGELDEIQSKIETYYSKTPLTPEQAERLDAKYKAEGRVGYVNIRQPGGALVRSSIGKMASSGSQGGVSTNTLQLINTIQTLKSKKMGSKQTKQTLEEGALDKAHKEIPDADEWEGNPKVARAGEGGVKVPRTDEMMSPSDETTMEQGALAEQSAEEDIYAQLARDPNALNEIYQMMAMGMLPPGFLDSLGGGSAEESVGGPSSTPGAAGIAVASKYE